MSQRILVAVAWPYANGPLHLGHLAGCYLPADIFARYHRMKGNDVLMVSGGDQHGTPITLRADEEGKSPREIVDRYQVEFLDSWEKMGITFDLFTNTGTENHREVVHDLFLTLQNKGYIYTDVMQLPYCPTCSRFLPDRYVEGTCPHCSAANARGDQCDNCGRTLDPQDLVEPGCRICRSTPEFTYSKHFFLRLSDFQEPLLEWVRKQEHWRPNVLNFTRAYLEDGLRDRAISRDLEWGVPIPVDGYDEKRIYVWFEAVIGYLSASKEWSRQSGQSKRWEDFWTDPEAKSYYFIGKDNIPFHSIIWPAMLMGYGGLNLPYDIPANEFLSLENRQFSTSRNWAVWLPDYLERHPPDPLRYYLSINMPETGDSDFSWSEYLRRNNEELVATYGNLVNRVLRLVERNFDGAIPEPSELDPASRNMLDAAKDAMNAVDQSLSVCRFRQAITQAMGLAHEANRYLDGKAPWAAVRTDLQDAALSLWTAVSVINCLKVLFNPFLPFTSQKLHEMLGMEGSVEAQGWVWDDTTTFTPPGQLLKDPQPLFTKLDDSVIEQETSLLGEKTS